MIYNKRPITENDVPTMVKTPKSLAKNFNECYLYNKGTHIYEKALIEFIVQGEPINKEDKSFQDVVYDIKRRQVPEVLITICKSKDLIIMDHNKVVPKAFTVFTAKDIKNNNATKIFMYNDCIKHEGTNDYRLYPNKVDIFIAHLFDAMTQALYYADPKTILMKSTITDPGSYLFSVLFNNVIDYLYKIGSIGNQKNKCLYLATIYFFKCILKMDINDSIMAKARKNSGLTEKDEKILMIQFDIEKDCLNIRTFIEAISKILGLSKLTLDLVVEKWVWLYGTGTQFALELFPSFSAMMTNAYMGCYLNNQKSIEKICGKELVNYSQALLAVGKGVFR